MIVKLDIAGFVVAFDTRFPDYVRLRCAHYLADDAAVPDMVLRASDADIEQSRTPDAGIEEAELYAMTIPFSEEISSRDSMMTHGVAVEMDGASYVFMAESGVGKSTHAFLWQKYLGADRVRIINGDKPVLRWTDDGDVQACGTPWCGKERLEVNVCVPLKGVCLLHRLEGAPFSVPTIFRATPADASDFFLNQVFIPGATPAKLMTFQLMDKLFGSIPFYHLYTDMSRNGVAVSVNCLTGKKII